MKVSIKPKEGRKAAPTEPDPGAPVQIVLEEREKLQQEYFVEYLDKCRKLFEGVYDNVHEIDSDVALHMHLMLAQFDQYRGRKGE